EKDNTKNKKKLIFYHDILGQYYTNTAKNYSKAMEEYQSILAIDNQNTRAKDILEKLRKAKKQ
ncbi:MAG: hypothetical protein DI598_09635, partial [Pseudopedobacter saltans]